MTLPTFSRAACALAVLAMLALPLPGQAQQVQDLSPNGLPPDLVSPDAPPSAPLAAQGEASTSATSAAPSGVADLGQTPDQPGAGTAANTAAVPAATGNAGNFGASGTSGVATRAAAQASARPRLRRAVGSDDAASSGPAERVTFERVPIRVPLPVGRERLVTLPAAASLHVPSDMNQVARIQNIDHTLYVTAIKPFTTIRVIAELLDTGQQIPLDFVAGQATAASTGELQISVVDPRGGGSGGDGGSAALAARQAASAGDASGGASGNTVPAGGGLDMVELTRYAARQLYAPQRLAVRLPGVIQIDVSRAAAPTLIRGVNAQVMPLGAWKSGGLYVTAVRVTNRSRYPVEIPLDQLRGTWIAATAQHGRVGPAGSDTDTTVIYLVSERPFEASL